MTVERRFYVYVVELRPLPGQGRSVYIGSSSLPPSVRFRHHKHPDGGGWDGRATSRHVRKRGVRLRPDLLSGERTFGTREAAKREEQALHTRLERRGFEVFGSCRPSKRCTL